MRGRYLVPVAIFLLLQPAAALQTVEVLAEAEGDVQIYVPGVGNAATSGAHYAPIDLLSLQVTETEETIDFALAVRDIDPPDDAFILDDSTYYVVFRHNDQPYVVQMFRAVADQIYLWGFLLKFDPDLASFNFVRFTPVIGDLANDVLQFSLQRQDLIDQDGAAPFPGRTIEEFWAYAHLRINDGNFINLGSLAIDAERPDAFDRMPETDAAGALPIELGVRQSGHAVLAAAKPLRASNGEATTFVFTLTASNNADDEDVFEITHSGGPSAWEVTIPDRYLRLGPGESRDIPVIVTTPFSHNHGAVETFRVEMQSQSDSGSTGRMDIGVRYHEVPQPAGHHNELWIHSQRYGEENAAFVVTDNLFAGNGGFTYINTLQRDDQDQEVPVKGIYWGYGNHYNDLTDPVAMWRWFLFLQPGLEMGLDFDLDGTGTLYMPVTTNLPLLGASMRGEVVHLAQDPVSGVWHRTIVAHLDATDPIDMLPGTSQTFAFEFRPLPAADLLVYQDRAQFQVELNLTSARPAIFTGVEAPEMIPGGTMSLPLFEYSDPVDEAFTALSHLEMVVRDGRQQRMANPGETALVTLGLRSTLDEETTFSIDVAGRNADWVTVLGTGKVTVPPASGRPVGLAIAVPPGTPDGERADIIITAKAVHEPSLRTLIRIVVEADEDADHPDDAATILELQQGATKKSPGVPVIGLLVAVAVVAVRLRRGNGGIKA